MNTTAVSETEALRLLNKPLTKREWLRGALPSIELTNGRAYERSAVEALRDKPPEMQNRMGGQTLHHR